MCPPMLNPTPTPSPPHPSGLSQSTVFELPASFWFFIGLLSYVSHLSYVTFDLECQLPVEEGMATHPSILVWRIARTEEPGGATVHRVAKSQMQLNRLSTHARQLLNATWFLCSFPPELSWLLRATLSLSFQISLLRELSAAKSWTPLQSQQAHGGLLS